jgi:hypothetical protein
MEIIKISFKYLIVLICFNVSSQDYVKIDTLIFDKNYRIKNDVFLNKINDEISGTNICTSHGKVEFNKNKISHNEIKREIFNLINDIKFKNTKLRNELKVLYYSRYCITGELFSETILFEMEFEDNSLSKKWNSYLNDYKDELIKLSENEINLDSYNWLLICHKNKIFWLYVPSDEYDNKIKNYFEERINTILIN